MADEGKNPVLLSAHIGHSIPGAFPEIVLALKKKKLKVKKSKSIHQFILKIFLEKTQE